MVLLPRRLPVRCPCASLSGLAYLYISIVPFRPEIFHSAAPAFLPSYAATKYSKVPYCVRSIDIGVVPFENPVPSTAPGVVAAGPPGQVVREYSEPFMVI